MLNKIKSILTTKITKEHILKFLKFEFKIFKIAIAFIISILIFVYILGTQPFTVKTNYLKNEKNGHMIVFQEMIHIADYNFYVNVVTQKEAYKKLFNFNHLYELINIKEDDAKKLNKIIYNSDKKITTFDGLQLVNQNLFLKALYKEDDINADITSTEFIDFSTKNNIKNNTNDVEKITKLTSNKESSILYKNIEMILFKFALKMNYVVTNLKYKIDKKNMVYNKNNIMYLIINYRNEVAVNKILSQYKIDQKNTFVTYGAAHYPEIKKMLEKEGYKQIMQKEMIAIH